MTTPAQSRTALKDLLIQRLGEGKANAWFNARLSEDLATLATHLGQVRRNLSARSLVGDFQKRDTTVVDTAWGAMAVGQWTVDLAGRVLLMATAAQVTDTPHEALYHLYEDGDTETRVAALYAVNFVTDEDPKWSMEMVHDAGRTYLDPLLDAAWCGNPYSAHHLNAEQYHKAVLKALFCNLDVSRFPQLEARATSDLALSLCEFANEREAAARPVPNIVWIIGAQHPTPGLVARLLGRMEHPLPDQRLVAAKALISAADPRTASFIEERLTREGDPAIKTALTAALAAAQA